MGRGVGQLLLTHADQTARTHRLGEIRLDTNEAMTENLGSHQRRGFTETDRRIEHGYHRVYFTRRVPTGRGETDVVPWTTTSLRTERLLLRALTDDDRAEIIAMQSDPELRHDLGGAVSTEALEQLRTSSLGEAWGTFGIQPRHSPTIIGMCSLSRDRDALELSYQLMARHWGQGIAREACAAVLEWAWSEQPDDAIIAVTQTANSASRRLLARLGFVEHETLIEYGAEQVIARLQRPSIAR